MKANTLPRPLRLLYSEGALLAAIPFAGSLIAVALEAGYLAFFDVPVYLARLDLIRIVAASGAFAIFVVLVAWFIDLMATITVWSPPTLRAPLRNLVANVVFAAPLSYAVLGVDGLRWLLLPFILLMALLEGLKALFGRNAPQTEKEPSTRNSGGIKDKIDQYIRTPFALIFYACVIIGGLGYQHARQKTDYWVSAEDPTKLLVEQYGGTVYVFKSFDPVSKRVGSELTVVTAGESTPVRLKRVHTGPLVGMRVRLKERQKSLTDEPPPPQDGPEKGADTSL